MLMCVWHEQVVTNMVQLSNKSAATSTGDFDECARLVRCILAAVYNVPRRRDLSYISALVRAGEDECEELEDMPLEFVKEMSADRQAEIKQGGDSATKTAVRKIVCEKVPKLRKLVQCEAFLSNNEMRRMLWMTAWCAGVLDSAFVEYKEYLPAKEEDLVWGGLSEQDLDLWGVYDQHTAQGRRDKGKSQETWLRKGIQCAWQGDGTYRDVKIFGKTYPELEAFYIEDRKKAQDDECKPGSKKRQAKATEAKPAKKRQKKLSDFLPSTAPKQSDFFALGHDAKMLGWKNLTILGMHLGGISSFAVGERVFVKTAESERTIATTVEGYESYGRFGLPTLRAELVRCVPETHEWGKKISEAPQKHHAKLQQALARVEGKLVPHLISSWFEGDMLMRKDLIPDSDPRLQDPVVALELVLIFIINKFLGHADLNEHNLMLGKGEEPHVMRVDMAYVEESRITGVDYNGPCMPMNDRGFQVSQPFRRKILLRKMCEAVERDFAKIAEFVCRLKKEGQDVRAQGVKSRWFDDDDLLVQLEQGQREAIKALQHDLVRYEAKPARED